MIFDFGEAPQTNKLRTGQATKRRNRVYFTEGTRPGQKDETNVPRKRSPSTAERRNAGSIVFILPEAPKPDGRVGGNIKMMGGVAQFRSDAVKPSE